MLSVLLVIIFISFIGVGLPDSVLGTAWPAMYRELDLPISLAGYIEAAACVGSIVSSFFSARLIQKFGTGMVTAVSTLLTAAALAGFAVTDHAAFFFLLAIPLGLGAGAVDTALNSFVALHYNAAKMSFLHCFYGIGISASPFVMFLALGEEGNWRRGYGIVAAIQFAITAVTLLALPLWFQVQKKDEEEDTANIRPLSFAELVKTPGVMYSCLAFFGSCALELTAGSWCSSYFVNTKGLEADLAAGTTMLFYMGLAAGRFLTGMMAARLGRRKTLWISFWIMPAALLVFLLPIPLGLTAAALFLLGLSIGPIYPYLVHLTPDHFGEDIAQSVMGIQQSITYIGVMVMPWLFGVLAQAFSTALLPYYLIVLYVLYAVMFVLLMKKMTKKVKKID